MTSFYVDWLKSLSLMNMYERIRQRIKSLTLL